MINGWIVLATALGYLLFLFLVAYAGDRYAKNRNRPTDRPVIYSLSMAVYCTSWTFFGSVGLAATRGFDFIPVYLGAILMISIGWPLLARITRLAKSQNITSIADFIAARYGKSQHLAAVVTLIAVAGTLPYLALQLKAVSSSVTVLLGPTATAFDPAAHIIPVSDISFLVALVLAAFAILFGTRHVDATEHQDGLILAIAAESLVKLGSFLIVGIFVTFWMFDGFGDLIARAAEVPEISSLFTRGFNGGNWLTVTFLSLVCIVLLPRQFHVAVVENRSQREVRTAAVLFPLYLVAINIFVVPIAVGGLLTFPNGVVDADMLVLSLPLAGGSTTIGMIAFVGGLSAATAMVIVASVALAIMLCNDVIVPLMLRRRFALNAEREQFEEMGPVLLNIRRAAIIAILLLAYVFHRTLGQAHALASIGLLSFVAIAQFAPAFFGGLFWRRATARGAIAGIVVGFTLWSYTMLLPWFILEGIIPAEPFSHGALGLGLLKPQMLFNMEFEPLTHGVIWSILGNTIAFIAVSLLRPPEPIERLQANIFVQDGFSSSATPGLRLWRTAVSVGDLQQTAARYVGAERAGRSFQEFARSRNLELEPEAESDVQLLRFTEHLLASAIGAASSRLVLSLLLKRRHVGHRSALKLLDDASEALQYNRDLLQSALDQVGQGISVFDKDMRLICWNRQFRELLELPPELGRVGVPLDELVRFQSERGDFGRGSIDQQIAERTRKLAVTRETFQERIGGGRRVVEIRSNTMPQGGIVTTYTDITDRVAAAEALARANETLERRVRERTAELTRVNRALADAKAKADEANHDKTRFLAAASHDILQPLNAARLYTTSLVEREVAQPEGGLIRNVDASLGAVEEILGALLDISRLDAGAMQPEFSNFPLSEIFDQLRLEFEPIAQTRGLKLTVMPTTLWVRSDRRLLRRVLQNLVSNGVKYTNKGGVVLGVRRRSGSAVVQICDTGPGIPRSKQALIFKEFQRLENGAPGTRGLGLGLSIVQRIARMLEQPIALTSRVGNGSTFSIEIPTAKPEARPAENLIQAATGRHLQGAFIICIDNEPAILDGMAVLLRSWGCQVETALDKSGALEIVRKAPLAPQMIFADYHLDEGTGVEAIEAILGEIGVEIPAVIITADHSPEIQRDVRWRGLGLLRKPVKPAALRAVMAQIRPHSAAAE